MFLFGFYQLYRSHNRPTKILFYQLLAFFHLYHIKAILFIVFANCLLASLTSRAFGLLIVTFTFFAPILWLAILFVGAMLFIAAPESFKDAFFIALIESSKPSCSPAPVSLPIS